ncbi:hypothetical protein DYBT9623_02472 [Dyadobacter sp. CECT 9623]|uniref:DUF4302 domain-containing protein n=1 Tax=Dyadobacter linearis TaxID=2823330 RepID=A0ABM8UQE9_9BACT|nr:DUF4302 domain-containing protein [Dyadobacter sp. CECT 9623]CAG5069735.1 hypothetical protein DYBT9623_02472 [Dyadobacter sp. CECT 9623]
MKKLFLCLLFVAPALFSCENSDDTLFEESADTRLNAALASYEKLLVDAPYGWNAIIYPKGGGTYGFHFKFNDQNRVVMYSDFSAETAAKPKESSYRLKAMQTPSLIFDTYSYLHILSDPNPDVNGGGVGEGLQSDFEFSIFPDSLKEETVTFVGRKNQSRLVLTKATQAQATAYANGDLAKAVLFNNISKYQTYFKRITVGNITYEITPNQQTRTIKLTWLEGNVPKNFTTGYYFAGASLIFLKPLVNGSQTINGFTNFTWNANPTQLRFSAGGANTVVQEAIKPLSVDIAAVRRWWQEPVESGGDWRTEFGFHVNGVDDAFGVKDLEYEDKQYAYYSYVPGGDTRYEVFSPIFFTADALFQEYGHLGEPPTFTADGRIILTARGTFGAVPTSGPAINSVNLLYEKSGYYLIQTSETTYDMVSAKDAKAWISWE